MARRRSLFVGLFVVLLGVASFFVFNMLVWRIPPPAGTYDMVLADLDGDVDLDAFLANGRNESPEPNTVLLNDGKGHFHDSGQRLGNFESVAVTLDDFDGDGDLDALVSNISWAEYFYNQRDGTFSGGQFAEAPSSEGYLIGIWRFQTAELNGDGRNDLFLAGCCGGGIQTGPNSWQPINAHNTVWLSDGSVASATAQRFGRGSTEAVALADLDGDGDVDAFGANSSFQDPGGEPVADANSVWFNDGAGNFGDSGQRLGEMRSLAVALGDLDGDGDQDALVGNNGPDEIWLNDGRGIFSNSGQALDDTLTRFVGLADFDGDGDLDALLAGDRQASLWWNDGFGNFGYSGQRLKYRGKYGIDIGDVDGNGAVDVVAGHLDRAIVWLNDGSGRMRRR